MRLGLENATLPRQDGDYLRIHLTLRRFHRVYQADWSMKTEVYLQETTSSDNKLVVVRSPGPDYCIIIKPPQIPVHPTVDNPIENGVHQLDQQQPDGDDSYLALVKRIDCNTSGLLMLATTPAFVAYFSKLLSHKTNHRRKIVVPETSTAAIADNNSTFEGFVCFVETELESVLQAWISLKNLETSTSKPTLMEHSSQPSERAPKTFVRERSTTGGEDDDEQLLECWMEITNLSPPISLYHSDNHHNQSASSWAHRTYVARCVTVSVLIGANDESSFLE
jgi:hypothetical protein